MKVKNIIIPAAALSLALSLGACGLQTGGSTTDSPATGSNRPSDAVTTSSTATSTSEAESSTETYDDTIAEPEPSLTGTDPGILKMGESFTYSDGLQVTLSKPTPTTTGEWDFPSSSPALSFTVTIYNGTQSKYDPSMGFSTAQIGNTEAEEAYGDGYGGTPDTVILPGREVTYKAVFVGTDTTNVVVEIAPDWDRGSLVFTPDGK